MHRRDAVELVGQNRPMDDVALLYARLPFVCGCLSRDLYTPLFLAIRRIDGCAPYEIPDRP